MRCGGSRTAIAGALAAVLAVARAAPTRAQSADGVRAGVARHIPAAFAPVASAILPGAGQYLQHRDRAIAYLAVEAIGWWRLARDVQERAQASNDFKALARTVARAHLSPAGPDGDWTYYEALRDWLESGSYSTSDTKLVPETDPNTFNGYHWQLALATTPDSAAALAQYARAAYRGDMLWSWRNAQLQYDLFKRATERRNDSNAAVGFDGTVLALNHLISMVDAFAAFRLDSQRLPDGRRTIGGRLRW